MVNQLRILLQHALRLPPDHPHRTEAIEALASGLARAFRADLDKGRDWRGGDRPPVDGGG
jgi:hypothetical protein